jgi:galactose mutarotase-like enzyme
METIAFGDVRAEVVPERGALVTALRVGTRDVLYLDPETLADPTKNVRGGIPLLFPFAGKLVDETLTLTGTKMKQHGFARNRAWTVTERDAGALTMTLAADAETRAQFPFEFTAHHRVMIVAGGIQLELAIIAGDRDVPVSPGWHPYFTIAREDKSRVCATRSGAEGGAEVNDKAAVRPGTTDDDHEFDFGMPAPIDGRSRFTPPGIALEASPDLRHLQMWSQPGKPFVCIEPFFGPAGTINTEQRGWVRAGTARSFWMRIRV